MPVIKTIDGMASMLNLSTDQVEDCLKELKILNPSGTPKKSQIDKGNFNSDGTIKDYNGLKKDIENKL